MGYSLRSIPCTAVIAAVLALALSACEETHGIDPTSTSMAEPTPFPPPTPVTLSSGPIVAVGFLPNGTAVAFTGKDMFVSSDTGTAWGSARTLPVGQNIQALAIDGAGTLFLGTDSILQRIDPHEIDPRMISVLRSTDAGVSWQKVYSLSKPIVTDLVLACNRSSDIVIGHYASGFAYSKDEGATWSRVSGYWCSGVAVSSSRIFFTSSVMGNVKRSDDLGATWSNCPGLPGEGVASYGEILASRHADTIFVVNSEGVLYRSVNGGTGWTPVWLGTPTRLCRSARGVVYFASGDQLFRSTTGGASWSIAGKPGAEITSLGVSDGGIVLVGTRSGSVIRWQGE